MKYKFTVPTKNHKTPSLNEYIKAERTLVRGKGHYTMGAIMKKKWQEYISIFIRKDLKKVKITEPVVIHYHYYEENAKRDIGNIHAPIQKFVEDSLQECGVIVNDNQKYVVGFTADFHIDKDNPRVVVELEETI